jgi:hypothetical protein
MSSRICFPLPCVVPLAFIMSLLRTECGLADFGESALQFTDSSWFISLRAVHFPVFR